MKEEFEEENYEEASENDQNVLRINKNDPLFHIFRMIVFLYEDLRHKLIKIIDENLNIDEILSEDFVELIRRQ